MKKPTLAIYGDSYTDDKSYYINDKGEQISKWVWASHIGPSYLEILEEYFEVTRFGRAGTSLYYSVEKFEKTHCNFDKIIFVVTEPGRFEIDRTQYNVPINATLIYGPSAVEIIKNRHKNFLTLKEHKLIKVLQEFYFPYMWKNYQQYYEHKILKHRIKNMRKDALVLDAFGEDDLSNLMSVQNLELRHWGVTVNALSGQFFNDMRKCHLTEENHVVIAEAILKYFLESKEFKLGDLPWATPSQPVDYYRQIAT